VALITELEENLTSLILPPEAVVVAVNGKVAPTPMFRGLGDKETVQVGEPQADGIVKDALLGALYPHALTACTHHEYVRPAATLIEYGPADGMSTQ